MRRWLLSAVGILALAGALIGQERAAAPAADTRLDWWREARFGLFIHWGLYAIPAGEWNGRTDYGEWIRNNARIPLATYDTFRDRFNPVKFDADRWVSLAKAAGMKYIVITTKHHDGFCLWDSRATQFDVLGSPFRRDILRELATACEKQGIRLCFYHSIMDWTHADYLPRRAWDARPAADADFDRYVGHMKSQLRELISGGYGNIGVLWFDGEWEETWTHELGVDLARFVRGIDPDIIINNRVDKGRSGMAGLYAKGVWAGDYGTPEQEVPSMGIPGIDWETCMTMNDTWGFKTDDANWKSPEQLIRHLCDIASKCGNFLLNVGPQADGTIPGASVERLRAIGDWMEVNGESIYGTQASPFRRLEFGRCTQKALPGGATRLYLHIFDWPKADASGARVLAVRGLESPIVAARLLGATAFPCKASRTEDGWEITLPDQAPDAIASVLTVDIEGLPEVEQPATTPDEAGAMMLTAADALLEGHVGYEERCQNLGFWTKADGVARWLVRLREPGRYRITARLAAAPGEGGSRFTIAASHAPPSQPSINGIVPERAGWCDLTDLELGEIELLDGESEVIVRPHTIAGSALMNLQSIRLTPTDRGATRPAKESP